MLSCMVTASAPRVHAASERQAESIPPLYTITDYRGKSRSWPYRLMAQLLNVSKDIISHGVRSKSKTSGRQNQLLELLLMLYVSTPQHTTGIRRDIAGF